MLSIMFMWVSNALSFTDSERKEIADIAESHLINNPEIFVKAEKVLQERRLLSEEKKVIDHIVNANPKSNFNMLDALLHYSDSPRAGKDKASVAIIEFFDYQCGYCRRADPTIKTLLKQDKDIQVIFKEYPIYKDVSLYAARMGTEIYKRKGIAHYLKYQAYLYQLQESTKEKLSTTNINTAAKHANIDVKITKISEQVEPLSGDSFLKHNTKIAKMLGFVGTPFFIVMPTKNVERSKITVFMGYPGSIEDPSIALKAFKLAIKKARS